MMWEQVRKGGGLPKGARPFGADMKMENILNLVLSIVIFLVVLLALYYAFLGLGIEHDKAMIEALVIGSAIITPVILYLFGRTWKKEIKQ